MKKKYFLSILLLSTFLVSNSNNISKENVNIVKTQIKKEKIDFNNQELNVYICADYIHEDFEEEFENLYNCDLIIHTYDTNETMYNQFTLQPEGTYDLLCTSEYVNQKMIREGLVQEIDIENDCPVYSKYVSKVVRKKLASLYADTDNDGIKDTSLDRYCAGYMWGTLGIIYDSECTETIKEDVKSWDIFWNENYKNLISIKNSMRDTFVVGLMHAYKGSEISGLEDILTPAREKFLSSLNNASTEEEKEAIRQEYNNVIQDIFDIVNTTDNSKEILNMIKNELISLKRNIFGFEVDSGKNDIITGKIKMNLAWSGDAVYSIEEGRSNNKNLEYYVPDDGSNVWYDAFTIPNGANKELACKFIDFLSEPENAAKNMEYIGYTSFIACDEVFDYAVSRYGASYFNPSTNYYAEYYDDENEEMVDASIVIYNDKYYKCIQDYEESDIAITPDNTDYFVEITFEEADLSPTPIDLSHIFKGNIDESISPIIYPKNGNENWLLTQYPSEDTLAGCALMNEFDKVNDDVIIMWGQVKADTYMLPYYIFIGICSGACLTFFVITKIKKQRSTRNKRLLESSNK